MVYIRVLLYFSSHKEKNQKAKESTTKMALSVYLSSNISHPLKKPNIGASAIVNTNIKTNILDILNLNIRTLHSNPSQKTEMNYGRDKWREQKGKRGNNKLQVYTCRIATSA